MKKQWVDVYIGLGGNIGNARLSLLAAIEMIRVHPSIHELVSSSLYRTSPVSSIPQNDFINCVCRFKTALEPQALLKLLQEIEKKLGKVLKPKDAPRTIDCDILLYGSMQISTPHLEIPHPQWRKRLFVLIPMRELTKKVSLPGLDEPLDLDKELREFQNQNNEQVGVIA